MGGDIARLDPGALQVYDGGNLSPSACYYVDNRDMGVPNSYEKLLKDMIRLLSRGWQPHGITRENLQQRITAGLSERAYQDTWMWELAAARLNRQAGFGEFGSHLSPISVQYVPAAKAMLFDAFITHIASGDRPAGYIGSGGPWMYPDRLISELETGVPGVAHKLGWLIHELREKLIPSFGICLTFQVMAEETFGRGTKSSGDYLLEYLRAPNGRQVEYHEGIRRYSRVPNGPSCFIYGVRNVDRVHADPLMHWIRDTPALMVHAMGVKIPSDRVPKIAVLGVSRRFFAKEERHIGPRTQLPKLFDDHYDVLSAARFGLCMRGVQFHPELTPAFCLDLSYHPLIACLLTDLPEDEWPSEAEFTKQPLSCFLDKERLDRLDAMRDEIQRYPWKKFVTEPKAYDDNSGAHGKRYPAGSAAAYNFMKFFVFVQYIVQAFVDNRIDRAEANMYLCNLLTAVQKPLVIDLIRALGGERLLE